MYKLIDILKIRSSKRNYINKDISNKDLTEIIEAASFSASAGGLYPWMIFVITDKDKIKQISGLPTYYQSWISQAPCILIIGIDKALSFEVYGTRGVNLYCIQDSAIACENILLSATEKGIGSCWVGSFYGEKIKQIIDMGKYYPVTIITLGYTAESKNEMNKQCKIKKEFWDNHVRW